MNWWKKCGDKVGMECVQEQPHVQLSTSHIHINIPTCGVFIVCKSVWLHLECYYHNNPDLYYGLNTSCTDIYVGVACRQLDRRLFLNTPILTMSPYFLPVHFLKFFQKFLNVLLCFDFFDGLWPL